MDTSGYVFVPAQCAAMEPCTLHVSFHGCEQGYDSVGTDYVTNTGFNKWADTNNIIVLYPQAVSSSSNPSNPNGCWDWWGYNTASNYDTKTGSQMSAIYSMMQLIASGVSRISAPEGLVVGGATNNTVTLGWETVDGAVSYGISCTDVDCGSTSSLNFTAEGLSSGTTYTFNVWGVDEDGNKGTVSVVTGTTTGPAPPIGTPTGLTVIDSDGSSVSLTWDVTVGALSYAVLRDGELINSDVPENSYTDTGLTASTTYSYSVEAIGSDGGGGTPSDAVTATTTDGWECEDWNDNNYNHVAAGRATTTGGDCYCVGSGDNLGLYNVATYTTVAETSDGYFEKTSC